MGENDRHKGTYASFIITKGQDAWMRANCEELGKSAFVREAIQAKILSIDPGFTDV